MKQETPDMEQGANMTRQTPMLFNADMIEALLDGRKTETRRVLKPQPSTFEISPGKTCDIHPLKIEGESRSRIAMGFNGSGVLTDQKCSAEIGDLIWVRENWRVGAWRTEHWAREIGECDAEIAIDYPANDHARREWLKGDDPKMMLRLVEQSRWDAKKSGLAQQNERCEYSGWPPGESPCRVRPSIHMPKWDSRLTLRVSGYGIERLQDIDVAGSKAEGVQPAEYASRAPYRNGFSELWQDIHGPDAWAQNPWVEAVKFEV
jgi:hypothetical protein